MLNELQLLYGEDYVVNDKIKIHQPTLCEIRQFGEQKYFCVVSSLCATPSDYKVQLLDGFGIDYEDVSELEFFLMICSSMPVEQSKILFYGLDLQKFKLCKNKQNDNLVLYDSENDIMIDNAIFSTITDYLRKVHGFEKHVDSPGNETTKRYILDKERRKLQREKNKPYHSCLLPLISALVNCQNFKYDYTTVWNLTISQFMDAVKRIQKIKEYDQIMQGIYAGTIDTNKISLSNINWMNDV